MIPSKSARVNHLRLVERKVFGDTMNVNKITEEEDIILFSYEEGHAQLGSLSIVDLVGL